MLSTGGLAAPDAFFDLSTGRSRIANSTVDRYFTYMVVS